MKRVGIVGHFGNGQSLLNGQTIKTKIVASELKRVLGNDNVWTIDTHGGVKSLFKIPLLLIFALIRCKNVVILPAQNGLRIIAPLLFMLNLFFQRKIHYIVIGGWMPNLILNRSFLTHCLKRFDHIYVETSIMKKTLDERGFSNVIIMQNCKPLDIISKHDIKNIDSDEFRLCIFSRIMKQKGLEHAVAAIKTLNERFGKYSCSLDIYGQIEFSETEWFNKLQKTFPDNVCYKGVVPFDKSVDVLKNYSALLFPTLFFTEGIPGTIIDAYAAGLPVISSKWASFSDIVNEEKTGYGYEFGSFEQLCSLLEKLMFSKNKINEMRENCIIEANKFLPMNAMNIFISKLR